MFGVLKLGKLGASMKKAGFNPRSLFSAGEQGVWYDTSDMSTLFQDSAGTVPVTAVEQPVGRILDKSGRGNHAFQATATSRPVLQQNASGRYYLSFDGVDDGMRTWNIDFTGTDKISLWAGYRKLALGTQILAGVSDIDAAGAKFGLFTEMSTTQNATRLFSSGSANANISAVASPSSFPPPLTLTIAATGDISGDRNELFVNGVSVGVNTADQGSGNHGNLPLFIGSTLGTSRRFNGQLFGLIIRGAASNATQITQTEAWVNGKTGAYA